MLLFFFQIQATTLSPTLICRVDIHNCQFQAIISLHFECWRLKINGTTQEAFFIFKTNEHAEKNSLKKNFYQNCILLNVNQTMTRASFTL